jgi:hypothetical protein
VGVDGLDEINLCGFSKGFVRGFLRASDAIYMDMLCMSMLCENVLGVLDEEASHLTVFTAGDRVGPDDSLEDTGKIGDNVFRCYIASLRKILRDRTVSLSALGSACSVAR